MFLSIIIPVYNTEKYLDECLMSILQQDIPTSDYQVICINDGSTDGSPQILQRYAREYPNVIVLNQPNGGVCRARNAGLAIAKGDYIWFVDADDMLRPGSLGALREAILQEKPERIIVGNYTFLDDRPDRITGENNIWYNSVAWRSILSYVFLRQHGLGFPYPELNFGEDALFMYECYRHSPKTLMVETAVYGHRERPASLSTSMTAESERRRLESNLRETQILQKYYEQEDLLPEITANRLMYYLWGTMDRIAGLPPKEARPYLKTLKESGLYPYTRPPECTIRSVNQCQRKDWIGKFYNWTYMHLHTRLGYRLMRLWRWYGRKMAFR